MNAEDNNSHLYAIIEEQKRGLLGFLQRVDWLEEEIARLREVLEKIVTLRPKPIGDSGFEQGPRLLLDQCQKIARAALAEQEKK